MNRIQLTGQIITSTNYATKRLFHFSPGLVQKAAENFLASGITEIEIPRDVIDPEGRNENGFDETALKASVAGLPPETRVVSTYLGGEGLGRDNAAWLEARKHSLKEIFKIIREKAQTSSGVVFAALEIDNPRQHPLLEVMCGVLYLKHVHGIESSMALSNDEIISRVFKTD